MKKIVLYVITFCLFANIYANLTLVFENDLFSKTDRSYTNGIKISRMTDSYYFSLFQWMYTPSDITIAENQPDDRPWAGWLGVEILRLFQYERTFYATGFQFGVIGPLALGEEAQRLAHSIVGANEPMGWANQIDNTPTTNFIFTHRRSLYRNNFSDVIFTNHNTFGNSLIQFGAGLNYRLGFNVPNDFGTFQNEPIFHSINDPMFRLYITIGTNIRYVVDNLTITGKEDNNVKLENIVYSLRVGPSMHINNWHIQYTHNWRSREFNTDTNMHMFGEISISRRF